MVSPPQGFPTGSSSTPTELLLALIALGTLGCVFVIVGLARRPNH